MKNTKFIKILVEERLPEKEGIYFIFSNSSVYEEERKSFFNGTRFLDKYGSNMPVEYWLEEKPDYEDEMKEMLERVINAFETDYVVDGEIVDKPYEWLQDVYKETKSLLTKLKT